MMAWHPLPSQPWLACCRRAPSFIRLACVALSCVSSSFTREAST